MRIGIVITSQKNFFGRRYENPREILRGYAWFTRREGGTERKPSRKIFRGSIYRVAGEGYFDTFLKGIFENLKI